MDAARPPGYGAVIMRDSVLSTLVGLFCASLLTSCGGAVGETLRPTDHSATGALGAKAPTCAGEPKAARPYIVDLDPDARLDLEASMKKGVTVVAYDCSSLRVLSGCTLPDTAYEFTGTGRREQVVQMNSVDELHANLPISSAKLGAEVQSGRSIDLGIVWIGRRATTLAKVTREDLKGSCDGATHIVQNAILGAFSMTTGSVGKVAAVAEVFNYGGGGKSESDRKAMNKDGSLAECLKSHPDDETPPAECRAPLRVELAPIAGALAIVKGTKEGKGKEEKSAAAAENPCPEGFEYADGLCTRGKAGAHLCDPADEAECQAQCDKGSAESCLNFAQIVRKKKSRAAAMPLFKKACDGGVGDGCGELGNSMWPDSDDKDVEKQARAALGYLTKGCEMGSGFACDSAGDLMRDKDYKVVDVPAALKSYDRGCSLGYGTACYSLARVHFVGDLVPADATKGLGLLLKACQAANADECEELGSIYAKGKYGVTADTEKAYRYRRRACELNTLWCADAARDGVKAGKETEAFQLADRGCKGDDDESCVLLGDYHKKGVGTAADEEKAKAIWTKVCKDGDGDDVACKRIGVKMKD